LLEVYYYLLLHYIWYDTVSPWYENSTFHLLVVLYREEIGFLHNGSPMSDSLGWRGQRGNSCRGFDMMLAATKNLS